MNDLFPYDMRAVDGPLLFGRVLDGRGGARMVTWQEARTWQPAAPDEVLWVHLCRSVAGVQTWLEHDLGITTPTAELLISDTTRPRAFREGEALVATLRGINLNPGAEPEDMVSMQLWCDGVRLITLRKVSLQTLGHTRDALDQGVGPKDAGSLITSLTEQMIASMSNVILDFDDAIDVLEEVEVSGVDKMQMAEMSHIRRQCLGLQRYMSAQHEALENIHRDAPAWFEDHDRREIAESIDRLRRYIEDIDITTQSVLVLQDEVRAHLLERNARTQSQLAIVATIFLPLTFLTGLLGINVSGIPFSEDPRAFWTVTAICGLVVFVQLWLFKRLRWF